MPPFNFSTSRRQVRTLAELAALFDNSGVNGKPPISTRQLVMLRAYLLDVSAYLQYRNDQTMASAIKLDAERVGALIQQRTGNTLNPELTPP